MPKIMGIDLSTTFSAIAGGHQHGKPEIISVQKGEWITLSVLLFDDNMPI